MNVRSSKRASPRQGPPRDDIRKKRIALDMSRNDLAAAVGSHAQTVEKIERGEITFSRYLPAIERKLGLLDDLKTSSRRLATQARELKHVMMRNYLTSTSAYDIAGISYAAGRSPDGKRKIMMIDWVLNDGTNIRGAMEAKMIPEAAREFQKVAKVLGVDLAKLLASGSEAE